MDSTTLRKIKRTYPNTRSAAKTRNMYDACPCCLENYSDVQPLQLPTCTHHICSRCVQKLTRPLCPMCRAVFPQYKYIDTFDIDSAVIHIQTLFEMCNRGYTTTRDFAKVYEYMCGPGYVLLLVDETFTNVAKSKLQDAKLSWDMAGTFADVLFNQ